MVLGRQRFLVGKQLAVISVLCFKQSFDFLYDE